MIGKSTVIVVGMRSVATYMKVPFVFSNPGRIDDAHAIQCFITDPSSGIFVPIIWSTQDEEKEGSELLHFIKALAVNAIETLQDVLNERMEIPSGGGSPPAPAESPSE